MKSFPNAASLPIDEALRMIQADLTEMATQFFFKSSDPVAIKDGKIHIEFLSALGTTVKSTVTVTEENCAVETKIEPESAAFGPKIVDALEKRVEQIFAKK